MALKGFSGPPPLDRIEPANNAEIQKIVNLEDPEEENDAVNLGFMNENFVDSLLTLDAEVLTLNGNVLILQ